MAKMNKKLLSALAAVLVIFTLVLTGCSTDSALKGATTDKAYTKAELNNFASITKGFAGDDFDYTTENNKSYDKWLSYMTDNLKKDMEKTIPSRIQQDKAKETVESFDKIEIKSVKKVSKDKKNYTLVNFNVYENVKHSKDSTKSGKNIKISGDIYLLKVGNDYKVDAFDYGNTQVIK
jgi:hypothetical protein